MEDISLSGRVAVVTGAGGGLGRAYALELARRGAAVLVNDTGGTLDGTGHTSAAEAVVEEVVARGGRAVANGDTVSTPEGGEAVIAAAVDHFGRVDAVVNNAGILRDKSFGKLDWDDFHAVQDVHLRGAAYVSQPAFRVMREQGYGRFVFVSSNAGTFGSFGQASYGSAKAGVIGLAQVVAIEGERHGILSNVVCPLARTRMTESVLEADEALSPEHVAPLVAYLASEQCRETHQVISAGAGHFARVFTGLAAGWQADPTRVVTAEEVAEHMGRILDPAIHTIPLSAPEELEMLAPVVAARSAAGQAV
ncbi:short-chain dehydrogenase [Nocardioides sp. Soil777]|uniref:SDR family NAD(P)-dependent oxidoreductase n=1 Tax=Nocardioides sp. Soil777 TaxID=1736409 RepID=UPI000703B189|nr:SDR family NAD(P)-dependent oxidoreductase [Nocardioides sp. Soil777]KRF00967.1 short-chain dehydrogenase [Nocardioides sp. Soil777]